MLGFSTVGWWLSTKLYMRLHGLFPRLDQARYQAEEGRQESETLLTLADFLISNSVLPTYLIEVLNPLPLLPTTIALQN